MPVTAYELPWYANGLRQDSLAAALQELTPKLLRAGALEVRVYRSKEDAYKFRQTILIDPADWPSLWNSEDFVEFRTRRMGWYQKPLAYSPYEVLSHGLGPGVLDPLGEDPFAAPTTGPAAADGGTADSDRPGHGAIDAAKA